MTARTLLHIPKAQRPALAGDLRKEAELYERQAGAVQDEIDKLMANVRLLQGRYDRLCNEAFAIRRMAYGLEHLDEVQPAA